MKHIKLFESQRKNIKGGYYVTIKPNILKFSEKYNDFLQTHIAKIIEVDYRWIYVKFILTPEENNYNYPHSFNINDIDLISDDIEDLKIKRSAKKYNL
jgi:hypothetical protein